MTSDKQSHTASSQAFRVGDHVRFLFRGRMMEAVITEDRGNIGIRGRRLLRVEVLDEYAGGSVLEMPEEELVPA